MQCFFSKRLSECTNLGHHVQCVLDGGGQVSPGHLPHHGGRRLGEGDDYLDREVPPLVLLRSYSVDS